MAFTANKDNVKKLNYKVFVKSEAGTEFATWQEVGACLAEPSIMEEKGDEIALSDGSLPISSKNASVAFTIVNVTSANRTALNSVINKDTDVVLRAEPNWGTTFNGTLAAGDAMVTAVNIFPALTVKGQSVNQFECTGTKEISVSDATTVTVG